MNDRKWWKGTLESLGGCLYSADVQLSGYTLQEGEPDVPLIVLNGRTEWTGPLTLIKEDGQQEPIDGLTCSIFLSVPPEHGDKVAAGLFPVESVGRGCIGASGKVGKPPHLAMFVNMSRDAIARIERLLTRGELMSVMVVLALDPAENEAHGRLCYSDKMVPVLKFSTYVKKVIGREPASADPKLSALSSLINVLEQIPLSVSALKETVKVGIRFRLW